MITFEQAQADESQRQVFLDNFFQENPSDCVKDLRYNLHHKAGLDRITELQVSSMIDTETADELRAETYESDPLAFLLITPEMIGKGDKHPIIVNPRAFEELDSQAFEYNILDHEYFHALDFCHGMPFPTGLVVNHTNVEQLQPETITGLLETRALVYQLIQGRNKRLGKTDAFMNAIHGLLKHHRLFKDIQPENDFERDVIDTQISSYQALLPGYLI